MADMVDGALEARLDTVKRGYDPQQVKRLVSTMASELRELDVQNSALRAELDELRAATPVAAVSRSTEDIVSSWTRETSEMLESARQQVARIVEKANADAAAVVVAAEAEADTTRRRAQVEADQLITNAHAHAAETVREAEAARRTELDAADEELQRRRDEIAELRRERQSIREQLVNLQVYLQGLVALIEPDAAATTKTATPDPAGDAATTGTPAAAGARPARIAGA